MGTIAGCVATADPESELFAALLVHNAVVTIRSAAGTRHVSLASGLSLTAGELITAITMESAGTGVAERVGRTPADKPIVAVVGRQLPDGRLLLAACGVADRPILLDEQVELKPAGDFRGSGAYRQQMVLVLKRRVQEQLNDYEH
jgi:CO/xanthine dehydrogenase FAD-binding subunit